MSSSQPPRNRSQYVMIKGLTEANKENAAFSDLLRELQPGMCYGLTALRLDLIYLRQIIAWLQQAINISELKKDFPTKEQELIAKIKYLSETPDLISSLDTTKGITPEESILIRQFMLDIWNHQKIEAEERQGELHKSLSTAERTFSLEYSIAGGFTEKHLNRVLAQVIKPYRLILLAIECMLLEFIPQALTAQ